MKKIEAIIRPERLDEVKKALEAGNINGMTMTSVQGCGRSKGRIEVYRGRDYEINLHPKVKIKIVVADAMAERMIKIICQAARTDRDGDGKIFVLTIDNAVRIRTGETGEKAI